MKQRKRVMGSATRVNKRGNWITAIALAFWFIPAGAQEPATIPEETEAMPGMDHSDVQGRAPAKGSTSAAGGRMPGAAQMGHGSASQDGMIPSDTSMEAMPGMDHDQMGHGSTAPKKAATGGMGHGAMQGGSAPSDARDPHAYSGGYTLDPTRPLKLADEHNFGSLRFDRLESARTRGNSSTAYDLQAWFGRDYDRLVLKAEGDIDNGELQDAHTDLLWGHAVAAYWDTQLGVRYDTGTGSDERGWLAFGVQGLAPYWFEVDIAAYLGEEGRTALRLEADYELLLTQKLILQPRVEANLYGKRDAERALGSGLSDVSVGLRLRYEIRREIAPYIGVEWANKFGGTADYARDAGQETAEVRAVAGIRFWF